MLILSMEKTQLNSNYWEERWKQSDTGWDIGYASPAIAKYIDTLMDKSLKILIPGCGSGYEAEYLHRNGFKNVFIADFSETALKSFSDRVPDFPKDHLLCGDFFELQENEFDVVLEQTFFCAISPELRDQYVQKMHSILNENGVLAGLLFDDPMNADHPPFGGNKAEYEVRFSKYFTIEKMEKCADSIQPRAGKELWFELRNR
jgi:hypothetical protein